MTTSAEVENTRAPRLRPRAWLAPIVVLTLFMALLGTMYLAYVVDPEKNLHDFPIALVNQDVGDVTGPPEARQPVNFGSQIAAALKQNIPADKIDLRELGINEAELQMQNGEVYGAILIPSDFSKRLGILGVGSVIPGDIQRPTITLQTNPRTGAFVTSIVQKVGNEALTQVDKQVGQQLTEQVNTQLTPPDGGKPPELTAATRLALADPVEIIVEPFRQLPSGTGEGLTAFFYALLLLLAGLVGSMTIHTMIDAALGVVPTEYGPWFVHYPRTRISRWTTLLIKWGVMVVTSVVVSGVFVLVGKALGMPMSNSFALYLYGVLAIAGVGITGLAILAAIGSAGLLVNLILFIILGLPSSGGTVPIEATPPYFSWLAQFEPMHQVFLGVRSILYFDGNYQAGLARGVWMAVLGMAIGLVLGLLVTRFYDRKGLHRGSEIVVDS
ncbi:YhgE/Pip domain-containing protein [Nocardia goodfellowii]|uniref:YhgE/Pip-like protein n=1 Tax=Nocardia goodfellowii TaxID=882446 RepID=A0ABS4Q956_9NOCA|nr:ABC transporter permease [Nocardia goodfellowii]MBP2187644.1 YhgE/Pip-like protein [Nocardia goodfellowii]